MMIHLYCSFNGNEIMEFFWGHRQMNFYLCKIDHSITYVFALRACPDTKNTAD